MHINGLYTGEMFLNFFIREMIHMHCGIDVSHVRSSGPAEDKWEEERWNDFQRWRRVMMGLSP